MPAAASFWMENPAVHIIEPAPLGASYIIVAAQASESCNFDIEDGHAKAQRKLQICERYHQAQVSKGSYHEDNVRRTWHAPRRWSQGHKACSGRAAGQVQG